MTGFRLAAVLVAIPAMLAGVWPAPVSARARSAQQAAPAPPAAAPVNQQPVFKAGVELVRLDVRVLDAKGLPIKDLKPDEVKVTEGGEPRPVVLFQHIAEPAGTYLEAARRTIGAEVSTNQGAPRGHLYLIVFDQNHITPGNEIRARQAVERFLRTRVKPGDRVGLYALPRPGTSTPAVVQREPRAERTAEGPGDAGAARHGGRRHDDRLRGVPDRPGRSQLPAALPQPRRVEPVGRRRHHRRQPPPARWRQPTLPAKR